MLSMILFVLFQAPAAVAPFDMPIPADFKPEVRETMEATNELAKPASAAIAKEKETFQRLKELVESNSSTDEEIVSAYSDHFVASMHAGVMAIEALDSLIESLVEIEAWRSEEKISDEKDEFLSSWSQKTSAVLAPPDKKERDEIEAAAKKRVGGHKRPNAPTA